MKTNKTIIPFTLQYKIGCKIGYQFTTSYPTHAHGIIVKHFFNISFIHTSKILWLPVHKSKEAFA